MEEERLVLGTEDVVFRDERVLGNVDEQVGLGERAEVVLVRHGLDDLGNRRWGEGEAS